MKSSHHKIAVILIVSLLQVGGLLLLFSGQPSARLSTTGDFWFARAEENLAGSNELTITTTQTPASTPIGEHYMLLPIIMDLRPVVEISDAWVTDSKSDPWLAFQSGEEIQYWLAITNHITESVAVNLQWIQNAPCSNGEIKHQLIFSDTINIEPGNWEHSFTAESPDCSGVYKPTALIKLDLMKSNKQAEFVVNQHSTILISDQQGFDKCGLPEVWKMQEWWNNSPYKVFNLYIGGISFACWKNPLDAVWVREVAEQGWKFIQTWVGPQAPCSSFNHKISWEKSTAYQEGRAEAQSAAEASYKLGFFSDRIIYYDLEAYGGDSETCNKAVQSFLRGWTERLHELGIKSGGYGQSCSSYMTDWASINPPPDDVWIATWYTNYYDDEASVWNAPCLANNLWKNHQRIKQYAGGHSETWGEVSITIDSNVLDGEINGLDIEPSQEPHLPSHTTVNINGIPIDDLGLFGAEYGWILTQGRLLITRDNGDQWIDITPDDFQIMRIEYSEPEIGWLVGRRIESGELALARTSDVGETWQINNLPLAISDAHQVSDVYIDSTDLGITWIALKIHSGSSFSLGRLFFTDDEGETWQERSLPVGEAVEFLDQKTGWTAGGPAGDLLYNTQDGGYTWQSQELIIPREQIVEVGLPVFFDRQYGWLPVSLSNKNVEQLVILYTQDGGINWLGNINSELNIINTNIEIASKALLELDEWESSGATLPAVFTNLPKNSIKIYPLDQLRAWVVTQTGICAGDKNNPEINRLICEQKWMLLATEDGGQSWQEITIW